MWELGSWVQVGDKIGTIQAWGIEIGISSKGGHPIRKSSRKKALASPMPMVLIWFGRNEEFWYPKDACIKIPAPLFTKQDMPQ